MPERRSELFEAFQEVAAAKVGPNCSRDELATSHAPPLSPPNTVAFLSRAGARTDLGLSDG
jgi:hypothetical protein